MKINVFIYFLMNIYECAHALTHKIPLEKTSAALSIKGILALTIWWIFYTRPLYIIAFPSLPFLLPLKEQRVEKQKPWRCRLRPHAWSLRTYIERSPAQEACDSHTRSGFNTTLSTTYHRKYIWLVTQKKSKMCCLYTGSVLHQSEST